MFRGIRKDARTIVVAVVAASLTAGAPAIAHGVKHALFAHNADKVDGKHAVASGATVKSRKGKLVATSGTTGRLPNNIIAKAPDTDKLDELDSSAFARSSLPSGKTLTGSYAVWGPGYDSDHIQFRTPLKAALGPDKVHFLATTTDFTTVCPGYGRAAAGHLCVYEMSNYDRVPMGIRTLNGATGAGKDGFFALFFGFSEESYSYGQWAVTAA